ncbi:P-loop NTPase fold protein [Pseudoalteromonas sp. MMG024]|uniref:KAP family P-loop NTPase fold protein n=1 Tax=Pseudoalteromonas sp. MMG024 TaxID=2909980 RepID=UPI001F1C99C4|nr:P-loop NTPase fold protein [Pseudoalteromonas sp. MMG024]MCF6458057.1 KAP family NTPase [Pseudoalteromonas sp. MMG024]
MWSDKESSIDFLNFNETAESIKDLITEKELMPMSIGIFGNWGAGKSTILELTKKSVEQGNKDKYIQIHFDAWMFEGFDDAKAALLETIAAELIKQAECCEDKKGLMEKAQEFSKRVDKIRLLGLLADGSAALSGINSFGLGQKIMGWFSDEEDAEQETNEEDDIGLDDVKKAADGVNKAVKKGSGVIKSKKKLSPPTEIRKFREAYSSLLDSFNKPLIVYVDNLDRCTPINAISTLEAIRLFLFMPNTAFIIAADEDMIRLAVPHYHKGASLRHQTDYLDKLIQIPVHVPKPGISEVRAYLMMLIASDKNLGDVELEQIRNRLEESLRLSWQQDQITVDQLLDGCHLFSNKNVWSKCSQRLYKIRGC